MGRCGWLPLERQANGSRTLPLRCTGIASPPPQTQHVVEDAPSAVLRWEESDNRVWRVGLQPEQCSPHGFSTVWGKTASSRPQLRVLS